ncbi:MAG: SDR family NAD(P)-dependent oxidoreductase [Planctomycetota bacterium]
MQKTILITGSTDGIGLETARTLVARGHRVLLHGRSEEKLERAAAELGRIDGGGAVERYNADLSRLPDTDALAASVADAHEHLDVLINNAGVFTTRNARTPDGLDVRFAVNTIAPYVLTKALLPRLGAAGRVVNLSSAAQAPVDLDALAGDRTLSDGEAYAQSKLALTMWSRHLAQSLGDSGPVVVAVNPGSMLATKMVRDAYGVAGADVQVGADILCRAALDDAFSSASGQYFDNDVGRFAAPHPDALDASKCHEVVRTIEAVVARLRSA